MVLFQYFLILSKVLSLWLTKLPLKNLLGQFGAIWLIYGYYRDRNVTEGEGVTKRFENAGLFWKYEKNTHLHFIS